MKLETLHPRPLESINKIQYKDKNNKFHASDSFG